VITSGLLQDVSEVQKPKLIELLAEEGELKLLRGQRGVLGKNVNSPPNICTIGTVRWNRILEFGVFN